MALAVLELLAEGPKHPYEIKQLMHERGVDRAIPLKGASIYDTVERLTLAMMVASGLASSLTQKVSGKYLLIPGLLMFAAGVAYMDVAAQADSGRWVFLPGLIVSGFGLGFVWTPVYSIATRNLSPELGGVASGVINTIQELGTVIASAAVGALLQNRLASALHD